MEDMKECGADQSAILVDSGKNLPATLPRRPLKHSIDGVRRQCLRSEHKFSSQELTAAASRLRLLSPKPQTTLPLKLVTSTPICSTSNVANATSLRPSISPFCIPIYQTASSTERTQPSRSSFQQQFALTPTGQNGFPSLATIRPSDDMTCFQSESATSEKSGPEMVEKNVGRKIQNIAKQTVDQESSFNPCKDWMEDQELLRTVIEKQRILISSLMKMIVDNKLDKAGTTTSDFPASHDNQDSGISSSIVNGNLIRTTSESNLNSVECKEETQPCSLQAYFGLSEPTQSQDSPTTGAQLTSARDGQSGSSDLELGRNASEASTSVGKHALDELRAEFTEKLNSLKEELGCYHFPSRDNASTSAKSQKRNNRFQHVSGKGKRRKNLQDRLYTPTNRGEESSFDGECRRSPRKKPKSKNRECIRRSASEQATKKISSLLKESDSEFSPLSDAELRDARSKSRRKLPPDSDSTFISSEVNINCTVKSEGGDTDTHDGAVTLPQLFEDDSGVLETPRIAFDGDSLDDGLTPCNPRSSAFSNPLPILYDPLDTGSRSVAHLYSCDNQRLNYGPIDLTSYSNEPLDLSSQSTRECRDASSQMSTMNNTAITPSVKGEEDENARPLDLTVCRRTANDDAPTIAQQCGNEPTVNEIEQELDSNDIVGNPALSIEEMNDYSNKKAFVTLEWQTEQPGVSHVDYDKRSLESHPKHGSPLLVPERKLLGSDKTPALDHVTAAEASVSFSGSNDIQTDEEPESDSREPYDARLAHKKVVEEFDFTKSSPPSDGLKHLVTKRNFPATLFSVSKGHGIGFLRPSEIQSLEAECGVGLTAKALRKVGKAKSIWRRIADCGKSDDGFAPGARKKALHKRAIKDTVLLGLEGLPVRFSKESSRGDESSDGLEMTAKAKKLKKRKERRRSCPTKKQKISNCQAGTSSCQERFPLESKPTESSGAEIVSESSPSLYLWNDELHCMAGLSSSESRNHSPTIKIARSSEEASSPGLAVGENGPQLSDHITSHTRSFRSQTSGKSFPSQHCKISDENAMDPSKDSSPHIYSGANALQEGPEVAPQRPCDVVEKLELCVKKELMGEADVTYPMDAEKADELTGMSPPCSQGLASSCVVNISPLKYRRSGSKWVAKDAVKNPVIAPLRTTLVRGKVPSDVTDKNAETSAKFYGGDARKHESESESSDFGTKDCEIDIAEWTMVPRRACSAAKQKISELVKLSSGKTLKKNGHRDIFRTEY